MASLLYHLKGPRSVSKVTKANEHERAKIDKLNYNQNDLREDDEVAGNDLKKEKNEADDVDIQFNSPTQANCNQFDKPRSLSGKSRLQQLIFILLYFALLSLNLQLTCLLFTCFIKSLL